MDIKKLFVGTIVGAIAFFFLGWLVYDKLLHDFMMHNPGEMGLIGRKDIKFEYLVGGQVLYGLMLAYIMVKSKVSGLMGGLVTGAVIGFLTAGAIDLTMYGTSVIMSKKALAADVAASTVISAIAGALIGMVTGGKR